MVLTGCRVNIIDIAPKNRVSERRSEQFSLHPVSESEIFLPISDSNNILVQTMTDDDRSKLAPFVTRLELGHRHLLVAANSPIDTMYFLEDGIASVVARSDNGEQTEVGIFGREGFSAAPILLGNAKTPLETFMQVDGGTALTIGAAQLRDAVNTSSTLRDLLLRYINTFMIQTACSVVSNAQHSIETRLARWLLMCHDRTDGDDIFLTHEFLAMMVAAQRSGVTLTLHVLEGYGAIKSSRGKVTVTNRLLLEKTAGDSYGPPETCYRETIAPFGKGLRK